MKSYVQIALVVVILFTLALYARNRLGKREVQLNSTYPAPDETYVGLRSQIFHGVREHLALPADFPGDQPWAVVMDWGVERGVATVVAVTDGSASMYYSTGGGSIGGGQSNESIRNAAKNALAIASNHLKQLKAVTAFPLPSRGKVFFYILTDSGIYFGEASQKELSENTHPLSDLGNAMQAIITGYRLNQN